MADIRIPAVQPSRRHERVLRINRSSLVAQRFTKHWPAWAANGIGAGKPAFRKVPPHQPAPIRETERDSSRDTAIPEKGYTLTHCRLVEVPPA